MLSLKTRENLNVQTLRDCFKNTVNQHKGIKYTAIPNDNYEATRRSVYEIMCQGRKDCPAACVGSSAIGQVDVCMKGERVKNLEERITVVEQGLLAHSFTL